MQGKSVLSATRIAAVVVLALASAVLAQDPPRRHFSGVINDYTPATPVSPSGPWEMRGPWSLSVRGHSGKADFSAALTMELSDYTRNPGNVDVTSGTASRGQHTHNITMDDVDVTESGGVITASSPVTVTKNGTEVFPGSSLTVVITGGTNVQYSNITIAFSGPAMGHFGSQAINGVVRSSK